MCEECDIPNAVHLSYAEKQARISAVWKPAGKAWTGFVATRPPAAVEAAEPVRATPAANSDQGDG